MVSQPCRFLLMLVLIMEKKSYLYCFDVVKIRIFFETTILFVKKMRFWGKIPISLRDYRYFPTHK